MSCEHAFIFGTTEDNHTFFVCFNCMKAEPTEPIKDYTQFKCKCDREDSSKWMFSIQNKKNCVYCADCRKIISF